MSNDTKSVIGKLLPSPNYSKLDDQKEIILKQVWTYLFHLWAIPVDGTTAFSYRRLTAYKSNSSVVSPVKEKKSSSLFGKFYSTSSSSSVTVKDSASGQQTDSESLLSYEKGMIHPSLEGLDTKVIEEQFWEMLRADPPDSLVWRFTNARKFNSSKAIKMLSRTLKFHSKRNVEEILNKGEVDIFESKEEGIILNFKCQKAVIAGYDIKGKPFILVRPKFHHSSEQTEEEIEKFALLIIELTRLFMKTGSASILFDLSDFSLSNMDYSPVKFLVTCFEAHYPDSLGCLLIHKAPWVFSPIWNIIKNWLDPVVSSKINFTKNIDELSKFISLDQIPTYLGGENEYDLDNYTAPDGTMDNLLKDKKAKEAVYSLRNDLISKYKDITVQWIETTDDSKSKELWEERVAVGIEISNNYSELDPYIRSRSSYDINGTLKF